MTMPLPAEMSASAAPIEGPRNRTDIAAITSLVALGLAAAIWLAIAFPIVDIAAVGQFASFP